MNNNIHLKDGERLDDLQLNNLHIIQNPEKFCFGMDAVLLSSFASKTIRTNDNVLDLGTGTGKRSKYSGRGCWIWSNK